jgi:predicted transcriptional regulator
MSGKDAYSQKTESEVPTVLNREYKPEPRVPEMLKSKRRDKLYIIVEILEISKEEVLKTQIMYRANLSFRQLNGYLGFMLKNELLEKSLFNDKEIYKVTNRGLKFLQSYHETVQLVGLDYLNILYSKGKKTFVRK